MCKKLVCIKCGNEVVRDAHDEYWCNDCVIDVVVSEEERTRWLAIKGTVMLYTGNGNRLPCAVYLEHINKSGMIVGNVLNTGEMLFPVLEQLVPFDLELFNQILIEARIVECEAKLERLKKAA